MWAPIAGKLALAAGAALLLAFIGARAGANPPLAGDAPLVTAALVATEVASDAGEPLLQPATAAQCAAGRPPERPVVLNVAGEEDLRRLPGIGPARAKAILALRERLVRFRSPQDLLRVKGIGKKTLVRMLPMLILNPPPASADAGAQVARAPDAAE